MDQIEENIFLGSAYASRNKDKLKEMGITHILVVGAELESHHPKVSFSRVGCIRIHDVLCSQHLPTYRKAFTYKKLDIHDEESENILDRLPECFEFISRGTEKGKVFIHCMAGISRSASVVIAFLMWRDKLPFRDALYKVKDRRPVIWPNSGFTEQLQLFAEMGHKIDPSHEKYAKFKEKRKQDASIQV